mgnify:CR=1 FL=1
MKTMSSEEQTEFLISQPRTAKIATVRPDGRPHVAPVWFDLDGEDIIFTTGQATVKAANLHHDPHVSICVDDEDFPFAFIQIDGVASISTHPDELLYWATRIASRYVGDSLGESYGKRNGVEGELLVRVKPGKVIAKKGIAD